MRGQRFNPGAQKASKACSHATPHRVQSTTRLEQKHVSPHQSSHWTIWAGCVLSAQYVTHAAMHHVDSRAPTMPDMVVKSGGRTPDKALLFSSSRLAVDSSRNSLMLALSMLRLASNSCAAPQHASALLHAGALPRAPGTALRHNRLGSHMLSPDGLTATWLRLRLTGRPPVRRLPLNLMATPASVAGQASAAHVWAGDCA